MNKINDDEIDTSTLIQDLEKIARLSPNTPKNLNFTDMIHKFEDEVRENVT